MLVPISIIYLSVLLLPSLTCEVLQDGLGDFLDHAGQVFARVKVLGDSEHPSFTEVQEFFSSKLNRSLIEVRVKLPERIEERVRFFNVGRLMVKLSERNECQISNIEEVLTLIFGKKLFTESTWFEQLSEAPKHLVGLSRLLYILHHSKNARMAGLLWATMRNQRLVMFHDNHVTAKLGLRSNLMFYRFKLDQRTMGLPMQVAFDDPDNSLVTIEYLEARAWDEFVQTLGMPPNNEVSLVSLPKESGCYRVMHDRLADLKLLYNNFVFPRQVSFTALVRDNTRLDLPIYKLDVAYDGYLDMLRQDKYTTGDLLLEGASVSTTIHDVRNGIKYHIKQTTQDSKSSRLECAASRSTQDRTRSKYESIVHFDKLVEIGVGRVRNMPVRMFEHQIDTLPALFFPLPEYYDKSKKLVAFSSELADTLKKLLELKRPAAVVYYFADKSLGEQSNSPLPIHDLFRQLVRVDIVASIVVIASVEVHNFIWSIKETESGDSADYLFALDDKCCVSSALCGQTRRAYMNALLEYSSSDVYGHWLATEKVSQLLAKSPALRNRDFLRALVVSSPISATQIHYIQVKPLKSEADNKLLFQLDARLSQPKVFPFDVESVGSLAGYLRSALVIEDTVAEDCFWQAIHLASQQAKSARESTLFSYCARNCLIDQSAHEESAKGDWKSRLTIIDEQRGLCKVYKVAHSDAHELSTTSLKRSWLGVYTSLVDKMLTMDIVNDREPDGSAESFLLKTLQVEIRSDRWLASENGPGTADSSGLSEDQTDKLLAESASNTLVGIGMLSVTDGGLGQLAATPASGRMNLARCYAACLARISCKSFSVCETSTDLECMTSTWAFEGDLVSLDALWKAKSDSRRREVWSSQIVVNVTSADEKSHSERASGHEIRFRMNAKCQIVQRNPLEMFTFDRSVHIAIEESMRPTRVESRQGCANLCLSENINFLQNHSELVRAPNASHPTASWCLGFIFLDLTTVGKAANISEQMRLEEGPGGICVVETEDVHFKVTAWTEGEFVSKRYRMDSYKFLFSALYERRPGYRLASIEGNRQYFSQFKSVESSAKSCFLNLFNLGSRCRSFDVVTEQADPGLDKSTRYCAFNTMSLSDSRDHHGLNLEAHEYRDAVHYEPLELNFDDKALSVYLAKNEKSAAIEQDETCEQTYLFSYLVILVLATASGLALGNISFRRLEFKLNQKAGQAGRSILKYEQQGLVLLEPQ